MTDKRGYSPPPAEPTPRPAAPALPPRGDDVLAKLSDEELVDVVLDRIRARVRAGDPRTWPAALAERLVDGVSDLVDWQRRERECSSR